MKKVTTDCVSSNMLGRAASSILFVVLAVMFSVTGFAQENSRDNDYTPDKALKSNARINPLTHAMELSIPIIGYPGRAGNSLPVTFDYSSKVWQIEFLYTWQTQAGDVKTDTQPRFAKTSSAGWTSSLGVPRIRFPHNLYKGFAGTSEGQPYNPGECYFDCASENYSVYYIKRVEVVMPDGSTVEFRKDDTVHLWGTAQGGGSADMTGTFLSVDGTRMRLEITQNGRTLFLPDGSRYLFGSGDLGTIMIDRNGNKRTYDVVNKRWTDTMGRPVPDPIPLTLDDFDQTQITVGDHTTSFPSKDGSTYNVTLSWRYLKDPNGGESGLGNVSQDLAYLSDQGCQGDIDRWISTTENPQPHLFKTGRLNQWDHFTRVCAPITWSGLDWSANPPFNPKVLTKITLPNGQKYEFKYNIYGEIEKIIYPTGSYERFLYGEVSAVRPAMSGHYDQANRGVAERWVSAKGDGTDELHWEYDGWETTEPDGTRTQRSFVGDTPYNDQPYGFGNPYVGKSIEDKIYSSTNQLLKRKLTGYEKTGSQTGGYSGAFRDPRPTREISIIFEPGESYALATMTETVYDTNTDAEYFAQLNPKQVKTYNYIVLPLTTASTATIDTIYALFSTSNLATVTEMDYLYNSNYKARNITALVTETRIKDAVAGSVKAKTQISYDDGGSSEASSGTMPTAAASTWVDPLSELGTTIGAKRGLPTTVKSYHDIASSQYVETKRFYDQFGNLRKTRDGRGNDTVTAYGDQFAFAYPTSVTTPIPDPTGTNGSNVAFTTSADYDYNTGLPETTTDANGQTTTMVYEDALLRLTKVIAPNGHQTINDYGAGTSETTRFVKTRTQIDATNWKEGYTYFDGLGRMIRTQAIDDDGDVFTLNCYDNMGRVSKVTNPFRGYTNQDCSTTAALEWTTNTFDTAGRPWKVTTPDNAVVETTYGLATSGSQIGTVVTVEDQADKLRRSITDALGRLIRVDEPNNAGELGSIAAPNQPTFYTFDTLGNLTTVTQDGSGTEQCGPSGGTCAQARTFVYDSLSRLKTATNPESGTISYVYDPNGNLDLKTDARGVVTDYMYDALNRVTNRSYSLSGPVPPNYQASPNVSYFYDNLTNAKGKLTKVSSSISTTEHTAFDILGRVTASKQTTDGTDYTSGNTYNLSGALIEQTYPSGRVVKNVLDSSGDMSLVKSRKNSSQQYWNYASNFSYNAAGALSSMELGNGRWESTTFNSRLQPTQIALGTTPGATNLLDLDYSYGTTTNNGNLLSQTITAPSVGATPGFTAVQNYSYDSLNRLKDAVENVTPSGGSQSQSWKQTFTFDRYGNRRFDESNTTMPTSFTNQALANPTISPSNNRLTSTGWDYDSSGNTTDDPNGWQFVYDAENKQVKVLDAQNATIGEYFYDGDGRRVKKVVPSTGEVTVFVYDASAKLIEEYSTIVETTNAKVGYLTNDHLGSPRINTDANGAVTSRHDYHPFGEEIAASQRSAGLGYADDAVRKQFTGYERDGETELDFAEARYYNQFLGRFSAPDPLQSSATSLEPQSWNRYVYVVNNPLAFVDPTGMFKWSKALGGDKTDQQLQAEADEAFLHKDEAAFKEAMDTLNMRTAITGAMQAALKAADDGLKNGFLTNQESQQIKDAVGAYGDPGKDNGVTVGLSNETGTGGHTSVEGKQVIVALVLGEINAANVAHEGSHASDALNFVKTGTSPNLFNTENQAYTVGALVSIGLTQTNAQGRFSITGYAPVASNGATTRIWGAPGPGENNDLGKVKANIPKNVATHLANNGLQSGSGRGILPAFPGAKRSWR